MPLRKGTLNIVITVFGAKGEVRRPIDPRKTWKSGHSSKEGEQEVERY